MKGEPDPCHLNRRKAERGIAHALTERFWELFSTSQVPCMKASAIMPEGNFQELKGFQRRSGM